VLTKGPAGLGYLPSTSTLWDTSWLLEEKSGVGGFVAGLLGYRSRPTVLEATAWLVYSALVGALLWRPRATKMAIAH
jgi:high-affinity iron transporter